MQSFLRVCMWVALAILTTQSLSAAVVAPTISSSEINNNTTGNRFTLTIVTDQNATGYYVVSTVAASPSAADIRSGNLSSGNPASIKGSFGTTSAGSSNTIITGLTRNRTYFIYFIVENSSGEQSAVGNLTAVAADVTAPGFLISSIVNIGETQFDLRVSLNEVGTVYYVVSTSTAEPSAAQIISGRDHTNNTAFKYGLFSVTSTNTNTSMPIMGLNSGVTYYVYFVAEDAAGNLSLVNAKSATTGSSATPPVYNSSSIINVTTSQFNLRVNITKDATVYYVVTTSNVAPSATQIIGGLDQSNSPALKSGSVAATGGVDATTSDIAGLTANTLYYVYSVARDADSNNSSVNTLNTLTACTATNATALTLQDGVTTAVLAWTNPACFDEILVVGRQDNAVTAVPTGNGSAYTASANFGAGTALLANQYAVYKGIGSTVSISSLSSNASYHFTVFTRKGTTWSAGAPVSAVVGPPAVASFSPADNSTNIPTTQVFTIAFTEPVFISTNSGGTTSITFDGPGTSDLVINRNSTGSNGTISIAGNVATLTLNTELDIASTYNVLVGNRVFSDQYGNDYSGTLSGHWNFTTATTVTAVTAPTTAVCIDQSRALGNIVLTEVATNNFQGTDNGTLTLALAFNKTGFSFSPGTTGVTATAAAGGDVESVTVTSVTATQALFSVKFKDVANDAAARDNVDVITLSGLKVTRNGASTPPADIVLSASSTLPVQGVTPGTTVLANITAGTIPAAPTVAWPNSKSAYCQGTDLSGIAVTASGGTSYNWYSDAGLTTLIAGGTSSQTAAQLFGTSPGVGATKRYVTNVNGCQSTATEVTLTTLSVPVADAGAAQTVCPQASVTLGGAPTASGGAGNYTYAWTDAGEFSSTLANPVLSARENTTNANMNIVYTLTVTDSKGCQASDNVTVTVKELSQAVTITQPTKFTYAITGGPVTLQGQPTNGSFSGTGVTQQSGVYQFDPEVAGIGTTSVIYTATLSNGCTKSITQQFEVKEQLVTGIEPSVAAQIGMHPNPANEAISITLPEVVFRESVTLIVIDAFGRTATVTEIPQGQKVTTVHTAAFAPGVYIVRLETSAGALHRRVVVTHD
ncbi:T9SS type A sorting domain-containing protein [Fulvivirgaceae bacterium PWU5]|uniref:T9SS type A sorting domain-containing protein n=1 Tax=Dawidia cretensis TaxID=2782350 RepID=A0AAP2GUI4_9BACT|nr:Ig-like domain-containing protein [Dawidia cretensis]MBT1708975.1 T9SS type A sorting domain-containing protein [Dawidia cretensis]